MRHWKYLLIVAVVAGGYWTGYAMKRDRQTHATPPVVEPPAVVVVAPMDPTPPAVDPSLILPPVPAQGAMIDIPIDDIRKQFLEKAGLQTKKITAAEDLFHTPNRNIGGGIIAVRSGQSGWDATGIPGADGYVSPEALFKGNNAPPLPDPVKLPPVIRIPAPSEEPAKVDPTVNRVVHRQITPWMFVNDRDLRLNFDVTKQGSSGIKAVELWARRSSEHDYECVDRMLGDKPPFITRLWSEGNYEFRLVFESGSGERTRRPTRNDLPDLYVCLDTTAPLVELLPPSADETGVVKLRWKASDGNLDDQPIRLQYSVDGETWEPVGDADSWLPNTGTYAWKVPADLPHEVHLRVQARDRAGNIGEARSPSKFSVDLVTPEGRICGVVERGPEPRVQPTLDLLIPELPSLNPVLDRSRELLPMPAVQTSNVPNMIRRITYVGADHISHEYLDEITGLKLGAPMDPKLNEAARKAICIVYAARAYLATVKLTKGLDVNDTEVVFEIVEGLPARVSAIEIRATNELLPMPREVTDYPRPGAD